MWQYVQVRPSNVAIVNPIPQRPSPPGEASTTVPFASA